MLKKLLTVFMVLVISVCCISSTVSAAEIRDEISPMATYAKEACSELTKTGTTAKCYSYAFGSNSVTSIVINQTLQKKTSSGTWQFVAHWNGTVTGNEGSVTNYQYNLSSGTYRLKSDFTFLTSSGFEQITVYSSEK